MGIICFTPQLNLRIFHFPYYSFDPYFVSTHPAQNQGLDKTYFSSLMITSISPAMTALSCSCSRGNRAEEE